eukprot:scaffold107152_cov57-Phaeocystis_antarctica.AAC.2
MCVGAPWWARWAVGATPQPPYLVLGERIGLARHGSRATLLEEVAFVDDEPVELDVLHDRLGQLEVGRGDDDVVVLQVGHDVLLLLLRQVIVHQHLEAGGELDDLICMWAAVRV